MTNVKAWSKEKYLPSRRHKKLRKRYVGNSVDVEIQEPNDKEFPIAFVVHDYQSVYEDAKHYDDFNGNGDFRIFPEEIRTYKGRLYKPIRITHGAAISLLFEDLDYIERSLGDQEPYHIGGKEFSEASIVNYPPLKP